MQGAPSGTRRRLPAEAPESVQPRAGLLVIPRGLRPRGAAVIPLRPGTADPVLYPEVRSQVVFEQPMSQSTAKNPSNMLNWAQAIEQYYQRLSADDWYALQFIAESWLYAQQRLAAEMSGRGPYPLSFAQYVEIGRWCPGATEAAARLRFRIGSDARPPRKPSSSLTSAASDVRNPMERARAPRAPEREEDVAPPLPAPGEAPPLPAPGEEKAAPAVSGGARGREDEDPLAGCVPLPLSSLLARFGEEAVRARAKLLVWSAPRLQDRLEMFVALPRTVADRLAAGTQQSVGQRLVDGSPEAAFARQAFLGAPIPAEKLAILRVSIPAGTPAVPIFFRHSSRLALALPEGTALVGTFTRPAQRSAGARGVGGVGLRAVPGATLSGEDAAVEFVKAVAVQLPAPPPELKDASAAERRGWPPIPSVTMQPPIQSFRDVPLADVAGPTQPSCAIDAAPALELLGDLGRSLGIESAVCYASTGVYSPREFEGKVGNPRRDPFLRALREVRTTGAGLTVIRPDQEVLIPPSLRNEILWYKYANSAVPPGAAILARPCSRRFTLVPLGLVSFEQTSNGGLKFGGHANYLIIDHLTKRIERFEPHGESTMAEDVDFADQVVPPILARFYPGYRYEPPSSSCPVGPRTFEGPQGVAAEEFVGAHGYCLCYAHLYAFLRVLNPTWTSAQVQLQMTRAGSENVAAAWPPFVDALFGDSQVWVGPGPVPFAPSGVLRWRRDDRALAVVRYVQRFNAWLVRRSQELAAAGQRAASATASLLERKSRAAAPAAASPPATARPAAPPVASARPPGYAPLGGGRGRLARPLLGFRT